MSVTIYQSTWRNISKDLISQYHFCENLRSQAVELDFLVPPSDHRRLEEEWQREGTYWEAASLEIICNDVTEGYGILGRKAALLDEWVQTFRRESKLFLKGHVSQERRNVWSQKKGVLNKNLFIRM
jgi:hypothetical protein